MWQVTERLFNSGWLYPLFPAFIPPFEVKAPDQKVSTFDTEMNAAQVAWRRRFVSTPEAGTQNGKTRPWILREENWVEGLWPGLRLGEENDLIAYLDRSCVQKHHGVHNLKKLVGARCRSVLRPQGRYGGD